MGLEVLWGAQDQNVSSTQAFHSFGILLYILRKKRDICRPRQAYYQANIPKHVYILHIHNLFLRNTVQYINI